MILSAIEPLKLRLTMIIVEVHSDSEKDQVNQLLESGWELKQRMRRQHVLCKGPCQSQCDQSWVQEHAQKYWGAMLY